MYQTDFYFLCPEAESISKIYQKVIVNKCSFSVNKESKSTKKINAI